MRKIRAKSVCLFRHQGKVLLAEAYDSVKDQHFVMPIGGGIEFGETSETTKNVRFRKKSVPWSPI